MTCFFLIFFGYPALFIHKTAFFLIVLSLGILPLFFLIQAYTSVLQIDNRIPKINILNFVQAFAALVVMICFVLIGKLEVFGVILAYLLANVLICVLSFLFVVRVAPWPWSVHFDLLKELLRDGIKLHGGVIATFLFLKIDQLMLGYYRQAGSVGFYTVAVSYAELLLLVPMAIQNVFYAKISSLLSEKIDIGEKAVMVYRHNFFLLVLLGLLLAVMAKPAIRFFYGDAFLPSLAPFFILLPGAFFLYLNNTLTNCLVGMRRFWTITFITVSGAVLNIIFNIIFIPSLDACGAAFASTLTYFLVGVLVIRAFLRVNRCRLGVFLGNLRFNQSDLALYKIFFNNLVSKNKKYG